MTKDDILTMASEAYCWHVNLSGDRAASIARLQRFAELVAAAEREACIRDCDSVDLAGADDCIAANRARGQHD